MTQIDLNSVHKSYGTTQVIHDVDLHIGAGEFCVFLGPSGCGKSTLLRMVAGLESISAGELCIGGARMNETPAAQRQVAMVFQNYALYPHMNLYENMAFGLRQARVERQEIDRRVKASAEILQISHLLERLPRELSGGQRQRVAIGRAIVRQPRVFLFDEPLSNLDAALRVHMRTEIARLHRDHRDASSIYVTHDQTEAMALADRIVLLRTGPEVQRLGSVAQVGAPMDLYHHPRDRFVAGFIGSPRMNFLPARVATATPGLDLELRLDGAGTELLRLSPPASPLAPGMPVTLGVRPEHLRPTPPGGATCITRPVRQIEHFGECSHVYLDNGAQDPLIAKVGGHFQVEVGEQASFSLPSEHCHLFDAQGMNLRRLSTPRSNA